MIVAAPHTRTSAQPVAVGEGTSRRVSRWAGPLVALLVAAGCATAAPDWRDVRLVKESAAVDGCTLLTILKDEDMNDLRRKAADSGGDTVLLTGTTEPTVPIFGRERFVAEVYRCRPTG